MKQQHVLFVINIVDILFLICILWLNGGIIRYGGFLNAILVLLLFIVGLILNRYIKPAFLQKSGILWLAVFLLMTFPSSISFYNGLESEVSETIYAFIILYIADYIRNRPIQIRRLFIAFLLIDCILINLNTVWLLNSNYQLSRIFASGSDAVLEAGYSFYMLGGYGYIYSLVMSMILCFTCFDDIKEKNLLLRVLIYVYIGSSIILIVRAQYTIGLVFLFIGIMLAIQTRYKINPKTVFFVILVGLFLGLMAERLIEALVNANIFGNIINARLKEMLFALNNGAASTHDLGARLILYTKTIKAIPGNLFFGLYEKGINGRSVLGLHTEWLDRLAFFGIVRYGVFVAFLYKSIKYSLSVIGYNFFAMVFCLITIGFLNPIISKELYLVIFFMIPLLFEKEATNKIQIG